MSLLPDEYERRTRLKPTLLVNLPPALAAMCWFPDLSAQQAVVGLLVYCGLTALLSQLGRDQGKRKEPSLFEKWGGKPTSQLLRHRDSNLGADTRQRYRRALAELVPHILLPTVEGETNDPVAADAAYDSCAAFLRERTRDRKQFPLVFAENVNYGFRRNLWGMRIAGGVLSLAGLVASVVAGIVHSVDEWPPALAVVATVLNGLMLAWWLLRINSDWVRLAAFAYAERLLASCDVLKPDAKSPGRIITTNS